MADVQDGGRAVLTLPHSRRAFVKGFLTLGGALTLATGCAGHAKPEWESLLSSSHAQGGAGVAIAPTGISVQHGMPLFRLGSAPFTGPGYFSYNLSPNYHQEMAAAGVRLFSFTTNIAGAPYGYSPDPWKAQDQWDFSALDQQVATLLQAEPDAMLLPHLYVAAPVWWLDANPQAKMVLSDGSTDSTVFQGPSQPGMVAGRPFGSLASTEWRQAMTTALQSVVHHIESSSYRDRIFGYVLSGLATEEWYHWGVHTPQMGDYSAAALSAFQAWLQARYQSEAALRSAWSDPAVTFATVQIPSAVARIGDQTRMFRDAATEMPVIDWYSFYNDIIPETIDVLATALKGFTGGSRTVGAWYCYMFEFMGEQEYGHMGLHRLLQSKALDFLIVTGSYYNRQLGSGADYIRGPAGSVRLHGKAWYNDNDFATYLFPQIRARVGGGAYSPASSYAVTDSAGQTLSLMRRVTGFCLAEGFQYGINDLYGGAYAQPELEAGVHSQVQVLDAAAQEDLRRNSEILLVVDERSAMYASYANAMMGQALNEVRARLTNVGAPFDAVLLDDLSLIPPSQYKLFIVLNAYHMSAAQRSLVAHVCARQGQTVLWVYAPGLFEGPTRSVQAMSAVTGIGLVDSGTSGAPAVELTPTSHALGTALLATGTTRAGMPSAYGDVFAVSDPQAQVLGVTAVSTATSPVPTLAVKPQPGGWTAIYSGVSVLPAEWYRAIARFAGAHIYLDSNDTLYANGRYVTISANGAGPRQLLLPHTSSVRNAFTGQLLTGRANHMDLNLQDKETVVLEQSAPAHWW